MIDIETVADLVPDKLYLFYQLKLTRENLDKNDLHENVRSLKLESIMSSRSEVFYKKVFLKISQNSQEKNRDRVPF